MKTNDFQKILGIYDKIDIHDQNNRKILSDTYFVKIVSKIDAIFYLLSETI